MNKKLLMRTLLILTFIFTSMVIFSVIKQEPDTFIKIIYIFLNVIITILLLIGWDLTKDLKEE